MCTWLCPLVHALADLENCPCFIHSHLWEALFHPSQAGCLFALTSPGAQCQISHFYKSGELYSSPNIRSLEDWQDKFTLYKYKQQLLYLSWLLFPFLQWSRCNACICYQHLIWFEQTRNCSRCLGVAHSPLVTPSSAYHNSKKQQLGWVIKDSLKNIFVTATNEGEVWKGWAGVCLIFEENIRHMLCTRDLGNNIGYKFQRLFIIGRAKRELFASSCVDGP